MPQQKQQITVSRSFPKEIYEREELERIVAEFASMCAEKLRASVLSAGRYTDSFSPTATGTTSLSAMKRPC